MVVNDPLSALLTMEGWYIANKIMIVLNQTNLLIFMLTVIVFQVWVEVAQEGEDEGNKGLLSLNRTEVKMILATLVCLFAVLPMWPANVNTLQLDQDASERCGVGISSGATSSTQTTFNGERVLVPVWWSLWHSISQGITNAAVSSIPCHYDIERSMLQISQLDIRSEQLRQETQDFYEQCFTRARIAMKAAARKELVDQDDFDEANWLGGHYFMKTNPLLPKSSYNELQAEKAVFNFPYNASRDNPVQQQYSSAPVDTSAAYPYCNEWWESKNGRADGQRAGLKWRLFNDVEKHNTELVGEILDSRGFFGRFFGPELTPEDKADMLVQRVLSVENQSTDGRIVRGYGQVLNKTLDHEAREVWNGGVGYLGVELGHAIIGPAYFAIREAMPMIQAFMITVLIVASPIVLTISGFNMMTLMSLTLSYFGLQFLTFWWELCRSLDSKLIEGVYNMHDNFNPIIGMMNGMDNSILKLTMIVFYVIVPAVWFGILGYTSYKVNGVSIDSAVSKVNQATQRGVDVATSKGGGAIKNFFQKK